MQSAVRNIGHQSVLIAPARLEVRTSHQLHSAQDWSSFRSPGHLMTACNPQARPYRAQTSDQRYPAAGLTWNTTYVAPSIWVSPLPAETAVEPQLPPLDGPPGVVGWREVVVLGNDRATAPSVRKPHATQGSRDFVRGSLASVPFKPGATLYHSLFSCGICLLALASSSRLRCTAVGHIVKSVASPLSGEHWTCDVCAVL